MPAALFSQRAALGVLAQALRSRCGLTASRQRTLQVWPRHPCTQFNSEPGLVLAKRPWPPTPPQYQSLSLKVPQLAPAAARGPNLAKQRGCFSKAAIARSTISTERASQPGSPCSAANARHCSSPFLGQPPGEQEGHALHAEQKGKRICQGKAGLTDMPGLHQARVRQAHPFCKLLQRLYHSLRSTASSA